MTKPMMLRLVLFGAVSGTALLTLAAWDLNLFFDYVFLHSGPVLALTGAWALLGRFIWCKPPASVGRIVIFYGPVFIAALPWAMLIGGIVVALAFFLTQWLLDPRQFWIALVVLTAIWLYCRSSELAPPKAVAKTLQPWLIAMVAIAAISLVAHTWLPRAQWIWLFRLETAAVWCEKWLKMALPQSLWANVTLLIVLFSLNIWKPEWKRWGDRIEEGLSTAKKTLTALAVFTGFTFFGSGQSGVFLTSTAEEKFARLQDQSTAVAELMLASRLEQRTQAERESVSAYLDIVYAGVVVDSKLPMGIEEYRYFPRNSSSSEIQRDRISRLVNKRVEELREYVGKKQARPWRGTLLTRQTLELLTGRKVTAIEMSDARARFDKGVDLFIKSAGDFSFHPLGQFLKEANLPGLAQSLVKDLYKSEASSLAKTVSGPLADYLFGPEVKSAEALTKLGSLAERAVFDPISVPREVRAPTVERRTQEQRIRNTAKKAARAR